MNKQFYEDDDIDSGENGEYIPECERCGDRGWIPANNGHDEYIGNGEIKCPNCLNI